MKMFKSSANRINFAIELTLTISLIKSIKSNGPKTEPWGTPHVILRNVTEAVCFGNFFGTHKVNHEWCKDFPDKMVHPGIGSNVGPSTNDQGRRDACMWSVLKQGFVLVWFLKGNPSLWFFYNFCRKNKAAKTTNSQFSSSLSSWNVRWENSEKNSAKDYVVSWIQIKKLNQHLIYVFVYILHMHGFVVASWSGYT